MYLNDASIIFERLLRQERTKFRQEKNYHLVRAKNPTITREKFYRYCLTLKEEHISFLNHTIIGLMQQLGVTDKELPLSILEARDVYHDPTVPHSEDMVPHDYVGPETEELVDGMDFNSESIDRTQLSILSLIPPDQRINGLLRLREQPELVDTEYLKAQVQKQVVKDNANVVKDYTRRLIKASLGVNWLEKHHTKLVFDTDRFKDPIQESEKIGIKKMSTLKSRDSELSMRHRQEMMGRGEESETVAKRLRDEYEASYEKNLREIEEAANRRKTSKLTELANRTDLPPRMKKKLARRFVDE